VNQAFPAYQFRPLQLLTDQAGQNAIPPRTYKYKLKQAPTLTVDFTWQQFERQLRESQVHFLKLKHEPIQRTPGSGSGLAA